MGFPLAQILNTLITLFVVIDPVGVAATYGSLTSGEKPAERSRIARNGVWIAAGILYFFALTGNAFLDTLGITIPAFRIAGGILLFFLAMDMILVRQTGLRATTELEQEEAGLRKDITVFPLAIPLIAGPGAITSVVLLMADAWKTPWFAMGQLLVIAIVLVFTFAALRLAAPMTRLLGVTGTNVVGRVLGILLAALAVQFVLDGLHAAGIPVHM
jgi:multiple antibiotic resistance protein